MLFDLRSRGRRRTVQAVYLGLAVVMAGGLLLVGVGTGNGFGGILNAFTGNGNGSSQPVVNQAEKTAIRETQQRPNDPKAWADLVTARWQAAQQAGNYDPTKAAFTAAGLKELTAETQAWQRYLALQSSPDPGVAIVAARAYGGLSQYKNQSIAWEYVTLGDPSNLTAYECFAVTSYAAGDTRKGDLASSKALTIVPAAQKTSTQQVLTGAKTSSQTAQQIAQSNCGPAG
jgi:hypothetical protein